MTASVAPRRPAPHAPCQRVIVIGSPGSGKTELGMLLAVRLGLPFVDLDDEHWLAGWTEPDEAAWRSRVRELAGRPRWVIAGHYGGTAGLRAPRSELVVLLDLPRALCLSRLVVRSLKIRLLRQTWRLPRECHAAPDWEPLRDYPEFLRYTWRFPAATLTRTLHTLREHGVERVVHLRSSAEVRSLTRELGGNGDPSAVLASRLTALPLETLRPAR